VISEIAPLEEAAVDGRPFGKNDGLQIIAHRLERKRVAPDDVPIKNKRDGPAARVVRFVC